MKIAVPKSVLLVCTANQCRSPAAEYLLRQRVLDAALKVQVSSSGIYAQPGIPPQPPTAQAMLELGLDMRDHLSQPTPADLMDRHDLILGMSCHHVDVLRDINPYQARSVYLLRPFCQGRLWQATDPTPEDDIEDPVGLPLEAHRACVALLDELLAELVAQWLGQLAQR